jgi:hypothetical protein
LLTSSLVVGFVGLLAAAAPAQAVTIYLNESNTLPDGPAYVRIDITDAGGGTSWDFVFDALTPPFSPGSNFGIQSVGFNAPVLPLSITNGPAGWSTGSGSQDGFGSFDVTFSGTGGTRQDPLSFRVNFAASQPTGWWQELSSGGDSSWFAAHVAGFNATSCNDPEQNNLCTSSFFGTADSGFPPQGVPEPNGLLILGTVMSLLGVFMRRRAAG